MSSKFECHYRQIFGGGLGQLSKSNATTARYLVGGGHTTANTVSLTKMLRYFSFRIKMFRCRRPPREFLLLFFLLQHKIVWSKQNRNRKLVVCSVSVAHWSNCRKQNRKNNRNKPFKKQKNNEQKQKMSSFLFATVIFFTFC